MTSRTLRPASGRPASLLALCVVLLFAVLVALPAPAQAHDTLLETDPADGATLETSPEEITLTFSADILEVSPLVRISDESGTQLAEITPSIEGPTATAELPEPLPAGTHTVQWRVVSSDGHPIEGTFTLTVEQGEAAPAAPSDGGGEGAAASDAGGEQNAPAEPTAQPTAPEAEADEDGFSMSTLIWILVVVAVGVAVAVYFVVRRRD